MPSSLKTLPAGAGESWTVIGGDVIVCKATGDETGGQCAIFETTTPVGGGSPPHVHHREDELFYVLEGQYVFSVGKQRIPAGTGAFLIAPRDIPHRFENVGDKPGKLLVVATPPGIEKFFAALSLLPIDAPPPPDTLAELTAKYGIEFLPSV